MEFVTLKGYLAEQNDCTFIQYMMTLLETGKAKFTALYDMVAATLIMKYVAPDHKALNKYIVKGNNTGDTVRQKSTRSRRRWMFYYVAPSLRIEGILPN